VTDITVVRGAGDRAADDIYSPLLCTDIAAVNRGRAEIDASTPASEVVVRSRYHPSINHGQLVEVRIRQRASWRGKVTAYRHYGDDDGAWTELTIWRPQ
jgi:hypothetical protein